MEGIEQEGNKSIRKQIFQDGIIKATFSEVLGAKK